MCQLTAKDLTLKHTITMAAMSTYPRLPFRPVELTLSLRKPTHPSPAPMNHPDISTTSSNKMSLSSLLSTPSPALHPFTPCMTTTTASSAVPPLPSLSPCPPPRQQRGHDLRENWGREQEREYFQAWPYQQMSKQKTPHMFTGLLYKSGSDANTVKTRRSKFPQYLGSTTSRLLTIATAKPTSLTPRSASISKKNQTKANTKTNSTSDQIEIDLDALTYYPPMRSTPRGVAKEGGRTGIGVRSKIAMRKATTRTKFQGFHNWNRHEDNEDERPHGQNKQRQSVKEFDGGRHQDWRDNSKRDDSRCHGAVVMTIKPGVHDREVKPSTGTSNAMPAMTSANAYSRSTNSDRVAMPLKKRFGMMKKKD